MSDPAQKVPPDGYVLAGGARISQGDMCALAVVLASAGEAATKAALRELLAMPEEAREVLAKATRSQRYGYGVVDSRGAPFLGQVYGNLVAAFDDPLLDKVHLLNDAVIQDGYPYEPADMVPPFRVVELRFAE